MDDGILHKYFINNSNKRIHKWIHYFDIYERHLNRFRNKQSVMLEIGVQSGGSLEMWKEYLGPGSRIIGIDINPQCKAHENDNIEVFIGDQDDPAVINAIFSKYPIIDIVLDDGSHQMNHMISSFKLMYHRLHQNGLYMVEDIQTCYSKGHGGGIKKEGTFIEFAKDKIDEINGAYEKILFTDFTRSTNCIAFYDNIVVFERRRQGLRQASITIGMQGNHGVLIR